MEVPDNDDKGETMVEGGGRVIDHHCSWVLAIASVVTSSPFITHSFYHFESKQYSRATLTKRNNSSLRVVLSSLILYNSLSQVYEHATKAISSQL